MSEPLSQHCPSCGGDVDFEPWDGPFPCPHCGVTLEHEHECHGDGYCSDYLKEVK